MLELVKRGDISKCSFKFVVETDEWRYADDNNKLEYDERTVKAIARLYDVSLVTYPAYKDTEASVREHLEQRKREALAPAKVDTSSRDRVATALSLKAKL
jgi:phage head maturation protease